MSCCFVFRADGISRRGNPRSRPANPVRKRRLIPRFRGTAPALRGSHPAELDAWRRNLAASETLPQAKKNGSRRGNAPSPLTPPRAAAEERRRTFRPREREARRESRRRRGNVPEASAGATARKAREFRLPRAASRPKNAGKNGFSGSDKSAPRARAKWARSRFGKFQRKNQLLFARRSRRIERQQSRELDALRQNDAYARIRGNFTPFRRRNQRRRVFAAIRLSPETLR